MILGFLSAVVPAAVTQAAVSGDFLVRVLLTVVASAAGWLLVPLVWAGGVALRAPSNQRDEARAALREESEVSNAARLAAGEASEACTHAEAARQEARQLQVKAEGERDEVRRQADMLRRDLATIHDQHQRGYEEAQNKNLSALSNSQSEAKEARATADAVQAELDRCRASLDSPEVG